ncbi:cysteine rich repeat-containing protein [Solidesulfovibrio sp.]|uniref:cysteine rich repeat-containing protein n=1 Tax=Solidesulfovibrio sp. TaxID=2910990 RepID=UPI00261A092C|nr:cysteine rich repeat-containing protein [Solidesulfovibrio sp.]
MQFFSVHPESAPRARKRLGTAAILAAALLLGYAVQAKAQQPAGEGAQAIKTACKSDYKTLCQGVQPGGGRIVACLKQNADKLSPACRQALDAAKAARPAPAGQ